MAATYNITSHPLLSDKAKALLTGDANAFDAVVVAAERTLGLHGTDFSGEEGEDAKLAVLLETNYELEQTAESIVHERIDKGEKAWVYRSELDAVYPRAQKIANRLLNEDEPETGSQPKSYASMSVNNSMSW